MKRHPILVICVAQLFGTSLWFADNGFTNALLSEWDASVQDIGWLTSAVQLGFITGTLIFASLELPDRYRPSRVFAVCAVMGALANLGFAWLATDVLSGSVYRFVVGLCLAGVYPVGMKLVVSWEPARASTALAQLVAMLTLGTALPHLMQFMGAQWPWRIVMSTASLLAVIGAYMVFRLGDGRPLTHLGTFRLTGVLRAFRHSGFRAAAFGYFGHMWELYAFWTLVPVLLIGSLANAGISANQVSGLAFLIIAAGAPACLLGGTLSRRLGSEWVATNALRISGLCCLGFPFVASWNVWPLTLALLLVWGGTVVTDSPQFSALSAASCPPEEVGSALAIMNCIGFAISVVSISLTTALFADWGSRVAWLLVGGPVAGLLIYRLVKNRAGLSATG